MKIILLGSYAPSYPSTSASTPYAVCAATLGTPASYSSMLAPLAPGGVERRPQMEPLMRMNLAAAWGELAALLG